MKHKFSNNKISTRPKIFIKRKPVSTSNLYDHYWYLAKKRQDVFFSKLKGERYPWSDDQIINVFKFTNAYRASDRTSQYLIKNVIYNGDQSSKEVFFRSILFKLFNKIETWELLLDEFESVNYSDFSFIKYDRVLTNAMTRGEKIYSAAYIMPSRGIPTAHSKKHRMHLELIDKMVSDDLPEKISNVKHFEEVYSLLLSYPGIGKFLAFQYAIDLNYSNIINFDEMDFVVAGPGATNGIMKCFSDRAGLTDEDLIKYVADNQENEFKRLELEFKTLWGRPLQLIDCQNLFCEVDKYSRAKFPELSGKNGRSRIKQKYRMHSEAIDYWYPPKWGINELIECGAE